MLATFGGILALVMGLAILLLPLLATELSRPRDSFWGAVVLLLGLVLVTTTERLTGAPMLAVLSGGLLIGRLGSEVGLARWRQLTPEEQQRLGSAERWRTSLGQLGNSLAALVRDLLASAGTLAGWIRERTTARVPRTPQPTKRWVRLEPDGPQQAMEASPPEAPAQEATAPAAPPLVVVSSFEEVDVIVQQAITAAEEPLPAAGAEHVEAEHVEAEPNPEPEPDREPPPQPESAAANPAANDAPETP
jgi:hypothetical protein